MTSQVPLIKERLSIVDVISLYLKVEPSGKNFKAKCPFHNEKTASFYISPDRGSYYCFGCGAKGDIFSFVEHFEGTDFLGALKILAERAGVTLEMGRASESRDDKERWYAIMEEATKYFEGMFEKEVAPRTYLKERGLTDATISLFRIGYAPNVWRSVSDYLIKKGFSQNDLETVGLTKKSEKGSYDRFRGRIIFPISDSSGRVIAFSGRIFGRPDDEEAKYLNSPDTPLFNKSNVLFGIDKAKTAIRTRGYSIIVEGQMDLLMSHQAGLTNTVAVSGTALADTTSTSESKINNLGLVRRLSSNVIFAYDGDTAGIRAAGRSAMIALALDMQVKVAVLPEGKDPADLIHENADAWKEVVKNSVNIVSFHIDRICKTSTDLRIRGKQIRDIVFPYLTMVKSSIERGAYINEIYKKTGISEKAIMEDFEKYEKANIANNPTVTTAEQAPGVAAVSRRDALLGKLFGIIFWKKEDEEIQKLLTELQEAISIETFTELANAHAPFQEALSFEAEMWYGSKTEMIKRDATELILNLEEELLQERLAILRRTMQERGESIPSDILQTYQTTIQKIESIKNRRSQ